MYCKGGKNEVLNISMIHWNLVHILTINFALNKAVLDHKFWHPIAQLVDAAEQQGWQLCSLFFLHKCKLLQKIKWSWNSAKLCMSTVLPALCSSCLQLIVLRQNICIMQCPGRSIDPPWTMQKSSAALSWMLSQQRAIAKNGINYQNMRRFGMQREWTEGMP